MSRAGRYGPAHYARTRAEREAQTLTPAQQRLVESADNGVRLVTLPPAPRSGKMSRALLLLLAVMGGLGS